LAGYPLLLLAIVVTARAVRLENWFSELAAAKSERPIPSVGRDDRLVLFLLLCRALPGCIALPAEASVPVVPSPLKYRMDRVTLLRDGVSGDGG
jgi:hypothetical protein